MLSSRLYPLPLSMCNILSKVFPQSAQAFYDAAVEPIFSNGRRRYLEMVPPSLVTPVILVLDLLIAAAFMLTPALIGMAAALLAHRVK